MGKTPTDYTLAESIYTNGANSKTYAEFTVSALPAALTAKTAVSGTGLDGTATAGKVYSDASAGATTLKVGYVTSDVQATYVSCKPGGNPAITTGCFDIAQPITISGTAYTATAVTNKNGRTLKKFSTDSRKKMLDNSADCPGCPYFDFLMYYDYYGDVDYADKLVTAALAKTAVGFTKSAGEMTFVSASDSARIEVIKKGTACKRGVSCRIQYGPSLCIHDPQHVRTHRVHTASRLPSCIVLVLPYRREQLHVRDPRVRGRHR